MPEAELVRRAQTGDKEAFRHLLEAYASHVERTARVLLSDPRDAEDAAQEAWLDAWRALPRFDPERPFRPWMLTIVANRCRMKARRHAPDNIPYDDAAVSRLPAALPTETAYDAELHTALASLDYNQRRVLALRYYADLQLDEIAELTGTPLGTVKSRLHRALDTLRSGLLNIHAAQGPKE